MQRRGSIAANAMTEDGAGSDSSALTASAEPGEAGYRLTGEKSFASNAPVADVVVTYAVTDPAAGFLGVSAFAVPTALAGVSRGEPFAKMGLTSCAAGTVSFDAVELAGHHLLGEPGQGAAIFQHSMLWERGCLFAIYLGMMRRQLDADDRAMPAGAASSVSDCQNFRQSRIEWSTWCSGWTARACCSTAPAR